MTFIKTYELQVPNQILITLPDEFKKGKKVKVTVEEIDESWETKMKLMELAATDPLFKSDINEITEDFKYIDSECL